MTGRRLVSASDKFRGTATSEQVAAAVRAAASDRGWDTTQVPVNDGGEGFLEAVADRFESGPFTGPDGSSVVATWGWARADGDGRRTAVLETARVSGLLLAGGAERNNPVTATSYGVGEQVMAAVAAGAAGAVIGCGGSATTDGGWGMVQAVQDGGGLPDGFELVAAVDVQTRFTDAARVFAPQKGARPATVRQLTARLEQCAATYRTEFGRDPSEIPGSGAAGGIAGAVFALGGRISSGFDLVAQLVGLPNALASADLVITGEGRLDAPSLNGKVVGGILRIVEPHVPVLVVVGSATDEALAMVQAERPGTRVVSLETRYGLKRALRQTRALLTRVVGEHLDGLATEVARAGP